MIPRSNAQTSAADDRQPPRHPSPQDSAGEPQALIPLAVAGILAAWLLSQSFPPELSIAGILLLLTVVGTLLFRSALIPALLFLTQCVIAVTERGSLRASIALPDLVIAGCLLVLLLSLLRYLQLPEPAALRQLLRQLSDRLRLPGWLGLSGSSHSDSQTDYRPTNGVSELLLIGVRVGLAVIVATCLLDLIPNNLRAPDDVGLIPTAQRTIRLSLIVAVTVILLNSVFGLLSWRCLPPPAARLFLNSQLSEWCGREIRTILRLEEKHKRRRR